MKNKRILSLIAIVLFGLMPANVYSLNPERKTLICAAAGAAIAIGALYKWCFKEPSNEELLNNAQKAYNEIGAIYTSCELKTDPAKIDLIHDGDIFALSTHKNIKKMETTDADLRELTRHITLLSKRIAQKNDNPNELMKEQHERMVILKKELDHINQFWHTHAAFFSTYQLLMKLTPTYNQYDHQDTDAIKKHIRSNGVGKSYPFKTFAETIVQNSNTLQYHIKQLHKSIKTCSNQHVIVDYTMLESQANAYYQSLITLRDVTANFDEYTSDVRQYNEDQHQRQQHAVQLKKAELKATAQRERADALRYKRNSNL